MVGCFVGIKIGIINDFKDVWYVGFFLNLVVVVWVGFDIFVMFGKSEIGFKVVGFIWVDFVKVVMKDKVYFNFKIFEGIDLVCIDVNIGICLIKDFKSIILEVF